MPEPGRRPDRAPHKALVVPAVLAVAYLVVLLTHLHQLIDAVSWNSDAVSNHVIAASMAHRSGGIARVTVASYFSTELFEFATRGLPFHRGLWEGMSLLLSAAGAGLVIWSVRRVAGDAAALLTAALSIAVSPLVLYDLLALRGPTWFSADLLLACLVLLATLPEEIPSWVLPVIIGLGGVVVGVNLASDTLLAFNGILPFALAPLAGWRRIPPAMHTRLVRGVVGVAVVAVGSGLATYQLMRGLGFRVVKSLPTGLAPISQLGSNVGTFLRSLLAFGNGDYPTQPLWAGLLAGLLVILLGLAAAAGVVRVLTRRPSDLAADPDAQAPGLPMYVLFWALAAGFTTASFVFSKLPIGGLATSRYVLTVALAVAATVGVWAGRAPRRQLVAAGLASAFCLMSALGLARITPYLNRGQLPDEGPALISYLEANGLTRGYAGYWDSLALTWHSDLGVQIWPIFDCAQTLLCQFPQPEVSTWYRPDPARQRSFIVVGEPIALGLATPLPASLGPPAATAHIDHYTVYVFNYDVATKIQPL